MKSYEQYCGLALALDHVGDRWTLLIVRELLTGPKRFSGLQEGLPGVATNLLAGRLRGMESDGLIVRRTLPPPAGSTVYALSATGADLSAAALALIRWGGRFMRRRLPRQVFRASWLGLALEALFGGARVPKGRGFSVRIELPEGSIVVRFSSAGVRTFLDDAPETDACIRGPAMLVLGLAAGEVDWNAALAGGLLVDGSTGALNGLRHLCARAHRASRARAADTVK